MKFPSLQEAKKMIAEAERRNPGAWMCHSRFVGEAAQAIASFASLLAQIFFRKSIFSATAFSRYSPTYMSKCPMG
jgi:hypothetical protein